MPTSGSDGVRRPTGHGRWLSSGAPAALHACRSREYRPAPLARRFRRRRSRRRLLCCAHWAAVHHAECSALAKFAAAGLVVPAQAVAAGHDVDRHTPEHRRCSAIRLDRTPQALLQLQTGMLVHHCLCLHRAWLHSGATATASHRRRLLFTTFPARCGSADFDSHSSDGAAWSAAVA